MTAANADFHFEHVSDCLNVRALSRFIIIQKEAAFQTILAALYSTPVTAMFVDLREVPGPFTFTDRYQLGELAGRHLVGLPVAALLTEEQADPDRIGQMVARNRGANVEVFTDPDAAQAWLQRYLAPAP